MLKHCLLKIPGVAEETYSYGQDVNLFSQIAVQIEVLKTGCILGCCHYDGILSKTLQAGCNICYVLLGETVMVGIGHECDLVSLALKFSLHEGG